MVGFEIPSTVSIIPIFFGAFLMFVVGIQVFLNAELKQFNILGMTFDVEEIPPWFMDSKTRAGIFAIGLVLLLVGLSLPANNNPDDANNSTNTNQSDTASSTSGNNNSSGTVGSASDINLQSSDECFGPYAKPELVAVPISRQTFLTGNFYLLPVPSREPSDINNLAFYPRITAQQTLGIIGYTEIASEIWLYIEVNMENTITQQGYLPLEFTTFTGNYRDLPELEALTC